MPSKSRPSAIGIVSVVCVSALLTCDGMSRRFSARCTRRRVTIRNEAPKKGEQVALDVRVGILLDQQGSGCVPAENMRQTRLYAVVADDPSGIAR